MTHFEAVELTDFVEPVASGIQLLFDSFVQPIPAGTRSAAMSIRQMLYRAEPLSDRYPDRSAAGAQPPRLHEDVGYQPFTDRNVQAILSDEQRKRVEAANSIIPQGNWLPM
jgi:hypothetical protein